MPIDLEAPPTSEVSQVVNIDQVVISGQYICSGSIIAVSSGEVHVISGEITAKISGEIVKAEISGERVRIEGYDYGATTWRPLAVDSSGNLNITATADVSGQVVKAEIQPLSSIKIGTVRQIPSTSGGVVLHSGSVKSVIVKAFANNSGDIYVGGDGAYPYSGYGLQLDAGESVEIDIDDFNKIYLYATVSGDKVSFLGIS